MEQPKISVIVPVYKVEPYLRKCLDSIVNQTYRNLEIILVDDGSPDNCGAICDEYAAKDERILVIHQANAGVSAARNAGLDVMTGEYINYVDSDDWLELDTFEYLIKLVEKYDADVTVCGFWEDGNGLCMEYRPLANDLVLPYGGVDFSQEEWDQTAFNICGKLYRASLLGCFRYPFKVIYGEDTLYLTQCFVRAQKVVFGIEPKYHYFQRQDSAYHQPKTPEYLLTYHSAYIKLLELLPRNARIYSGCVRNLVLSSLDYCSKAVFDPGFAPAKRECRQLFRANMGDILSNRSISRKDRVKSILIAYAWWLYRPLLLASKKIKKM